MPNDTESPDRAGLIASANDLHELMGERMSAHTKIDRIADFGREYYVKGVASQSTELAALRGDNAELQKEVNALAGQVQDRDGLIERLKLMVSYRNDRLAVLMCDCGTSTLMPDKRKAMIYHQYECAYRKFVAKREGEPVGAK